MKPYLKKTGGVAAPSYGGPAMKHNIKPVAKHSIGKAPNVAPGAGGNGKPWVVNAPGTAGAAATAPTPTVAPLDDAGYNSAINMANRTYADEELGLNQKEYGVKEQYGFDPQFANNPYTRANMLKRAADQRFRGTLNSSAGAGQLYSGATSRAQLSNDFQTGAETDEARRSYTSALQEIEASRLSSARDRDSGYDRAYLDMIDRAAANAPSPSMFAQPAFEPNKTKPKPKPKGKK